VFKPTNNCLVRQTRQVDDYINQAKEPFSWLKGM